MKTQTVIEYNAVDVTAKSDSSYSVTDKQSFANMDNLKINKLAEVKYSTLERNYFVLDGETENMGKNVTNVAFWSKTMSDSTGTMQSIPVITITFTESVHSSLGLTLTFSKYTYCSQLTITYYNSSD